MKDCRLEVSNSRKSFEVQVLNSSSSVKGALSEVTFLVIGILVMEILLQ